MILGGPAEGQSLLTAGSELKNAEEAANAAHSAAQLGRLNAILRLQQTLSRGKIILKDALNLGSRRAAVFDTSTGQLYLGSATQGTHLGVIAEHGLQVSEKLVGGFVDVTSQGQMTFRAESGTFPLIHQANPGAVLDMIRGTGVSVSSNGL
jgi:hypothetical protein